MQLFDAERPEISPGTKALLLDGSAVPIIMCQPTPDGKVRLSVMLRHYDNHGGYSWHTRLFMKEDLEDFFRAYEEDPELALSDYFDWTAQVPLRTVPITKPPTTSQTQANTYADDLL